MAGISVFSSLDEAEAAGFTFFLRSADAIIVQRTNGRSRALAVVENASQQVLEVSTR
jgi:hypothetical protein